MAYRKYVIVLALLLQAFALKAQQDPYIHADTISYELYKAGEWQKLIAYADSALATGLDFQLLRYRLAYARFVTEDYKAALQQYNAIITADSYAPVARYYAYFCNLYLNNEPGSFANAAYLDSATLKKEGIARFAFTCAALEAGIKAPESAGRQTGLYTRAGLSNRVGWHLLLDQSVIYFNQKVNGPAVNVNPPGILGPVNTRVNDDSQIEYFLKARYSLNQKFTLLSAYHYLNTNYAGTTYNSNIGVLGFIYTGGRYTDLQADINLGSIYSSRLLQYNAQLTWYSNGNLNLYTISKASLKSYNSATEFIFGQSIGFKTGRKTWLEANITLGNLENYVDADGLYIYNAIDPTKFKTGATFFYRLNLHTMLQINYTYETKYDIYRLDNYGQHSITAGVAWKF
ncbi:hypothetical protein [Mucilaginibacter ginkgonis]|uniref:YaiO family outer membrane protein n=1 Tax=Mucilaginibacter ginkgonis TaxID=2682091 RepID=A0A6I4IMR0_9SPHI|nr:hypothetical protein [Mucilaginibacter ginkgonis]QQL50230.1 hypothetical protein GO620_001900 [Mucilaginibacter ginkgonis]